MGRVVQVTAGDPKFNELKVWVCPRFDAAASAFIVGDKSYRATAPKTPTDEYNYICETAPIVLTDGFMHQVEANSKYDMDDPSQAIIIDMAIDCGILAKSRNAFNPASRHVFYIKDDEAEATDSIRNAELVSNALELVFGMTDRERVRFAYYMNQPVRTMTDKQVDAFVKGVAVKDPQSIITAMKNDRWKILSALRKAVHYGVLRIESGIYKMGDNVIGIDEDAAVAFFRDRSNGDLVDQIAARIRDVELSEHPGRVVQPAPALPQESAQVIEPKTSKREARK